MSFYRGVHEGRTDSNDAGDRGTDPGKRTRTASLPTQPSAVPTAGATSVGRRPEAVPYADPFAIHVTSKPVTNGGGGAGGEGAGDANNQTTEADMIQEESSAAAEGAGGESGAAGGAQGAQAGSGGGGGGGGGAGGGTATASPVATPAEPGASATEGAGAGTGGETGAATSGTAPKQAATTLFIQGPRELWFFNGETPAGYEVSRGLSSNRSGGTFRWTCSPNLTLSAAGDARPTVTSAAASAAANDAFIRLQHTAADGSTSAASYRLTIKAPTSLGHLSDVDTTDPTFVYASFIHYSIQDQFGAILPRNVPINEQFTAAPTADFPGMDWRRGPEGGATVSPTDWADHIQGETPGHTPEPVPPGGAGAGTAVYHWPGIWRVGSLTIGSGRQVAAVTWSKSRGFARHT